jgi:hypothetical protein
MIANVNPIKVGDRIRLISMPEDPDPIDPGTCGVIVGIYPQSDWVQIDVQWDNGRTLMLSVAPDGVETINQQSARQ